jgi:hypothetical protein
VHIESSDGPADAVVDGIAYVCDSLAAIRARLESDGDPLVLDRLLAALRSGKDPAGPLEELNTALQAAGDALGVYGHTRGDYGNTRGDYGPGASPHGIGPPRPAEVLYLCPGRRCSRYWLPDPSAAVPRCTLEGEPLRAERL